MNDVLAGIRVIEVAAWTFVPSSCGIMAEWGADIIKIEHPELGDPQRGLVTSALIQQSGVNFMVELPNRGKRSVGLDIATPAGRELLYRLIEGADVFVTSFLPDVRARLGIDVEQIRARNPNIIYVRGSAHGPRGAEAGRGGFDAASYWARAGIATAMTEQGAEWPAAGRSSFGDFMGGMALAGGVAAALLRRERTGVPAIVDVSLLGLGVWNLAQDITAAKLSEGRPAPVMDRDAMPNPLAATYRTKDERFITLMMFQSDRFWPDFCAHIDRPDLIEDARFKDSKARYENSRACTQVLRDVFATRTLEQWCARFATLQGVWAPVRTPREVHDDAQVIANGYLTELTTETGRSMSAPTNPVQFDMTPPAVRGAPGHGEHTDEVLGELGLSLDEILQHKASGAVL